jgi:hypothetical protein
VIVFATLGHGVAVAAKSALVGKTSQGGAWFSSCKVS